MIFNENRLLADDSHEVSYLIFFHKLGRMSQNLLSVAVVIGASRVNPFPTSHDFFCLLMLLGSLNYKQYGPRSDCSQIRVHGVCFHD